MAADRAPSPEDVLRRHASGDDLTRHDTRALVAAVLEGTLPIDRFGVWLASTADRVASAAEIAGVADALRSRMRPIHAPQPIVGDTCGTGGDGSGTFNISTAAAIVVAATGLPVAKHGNRAISSRTGSADVLERLGVEVAPPVSVAERCLADVGIVFLFAPAHHPALALLRDLRRSLGRPTVFNLVGPLCNPAGAGVQVIGVGRDDARRPVAEAAGMLGLQRAVVVRSEDGVDEVGLFAPTRVLDVSPAGMRETTWTPEDFGLSTAATDDRGRLLAADADESAACIRGVLDGEPGPRRDIVVLNAAALLWAAGRAGDLTKAAQLAMAAIDSGGARSVLERLRLASHAAPGREPT
jgi:anthranilate phosphoribosyltransferase